MRIVVYEFVTGGGWPAGDPPPSSLVEEGRAMRDALAADLAAAAIGEVLTLVDRRFGSVPPAGCAISLSDDWPSEHHGLDAAARWADVMLIIAPEFDGILADRHRWAAEAGRLVLGHSQSLIALAADKQLTAEHLAERGVGVPLGRRLSAGQRLPRDFPYPAVLKPVDGAGSLDVRWISEPDDLDVLQPTRGQWRLEPFCPGLAASVAVLCGPSGASVLPACRQLLGSAQPGSNAPGGRPPSFEYRGGQLPLPPGLDARAGSLARRVLATLDGACGWLGIDLILGEDPAGSDDRVIEINPRLTTSYLGLRALVRENLAAALLAIARGEPAPLSLRPGALQFAPDGLVTWLVD